MRLDQIPLMIQVVIDVLWFVRDYLKYRDPKAGM